jgi:hypothetical protein
MPTTSCENKPAIGTFLSYQINTNQQPNKQAQSLLDEGFFAIFYF